MQDIDIQSFAITDQKSEAHTYLRGIQSPHSKPLPFPKDGEAFVLNAHHEPRAFVAVFDAEHMLNTEKNTAILGFYEALSEDDGVTLLTHVERQLKEKGIATLIGPMNQNTWGQYRFALQKMPSDPEFSPHNFLGDVINHESYPSHFQSVGFAPISHYQSRATRNLSMRHPKRKEIERNLADHGIRIEAIDMAKFNQTLQEIFFLSVEGFSANKFFAPIGFEYFADIYRGIEPIIDRDLFLLARNRTNELVGFIFAYQDPLGQEKRVVLKSMTINKAVRGMGLGLFLMEEVQRIAFEKQFDMAIHALMYVDNTTKGISEGGMGSVMFRRYALFGKAI